MSLIIWLSALASFVLTLIVLPRFKGYLEEAGVIDMDAQKADKPWMASSGGLPVIFGFWAGIMGFVFLDTFHYYFKSNAAEIFAATLAITIAMLIGLLDDIHSRRKRVRGIAPGRSGLLQWQKPLLTVAAAVPLMAVRAGVTTLSVPTLGSVDFGLLYPLLLVPLAVVCVTNATNMLAGMNGLEAGMGVVALLGVGTYAIQTGSLEGGAIAITTAAALLAFFIFNFYPARLLQGDSLTYLIGAAYVSTVIIGNIEKFGVIVFTPWIVEAFLKLRSGFRASSLGVLQVNGTLETKSEKIYSLTHVAMRFGLTERQIVFAFIAMEVAVVIAAHMIVRVV